MKAYKGMRINGNVMVLVEGAQLSPARSQKVWNHSPDGFEWGYGGSGPAQLALALLLDVFQDKHLAVKWHQDFKWRTVARWPRDKVWRITETEIRQICAEIEGKALPTTTTESESSLLFDL